VAGERQRFGGHAGKILTVSLSRDATRALSTGADATVRLWDAQTGQELLQFGQRLADIKGAALSPDARHVVVSGDSLVLYDARTGKERWRDSRAFDSVAFAADHHFFAAGSRGDFQIWTIVEDVEPVRRGYGVPSPTWGRMQSITMSANAALLAFVPADGVLHIRHTVERREIGPLRSLVIVPALAFAPDGRSLVWAASDNGIHMWNVNTEREARAWRGHRGRVTSLAFSGDGARFVSGSADHTVRIWDARSARVLQVFTGHTAKVTSVAFSGDGHHVLSGSDDGTVRLWYVP
jgi:WD40 repeat protein